ncbi:MAG TPA: hypothetical protein VEB22_03395 [Phycisphaerales bacterium]|nr:hypothetical protein [Phycisphaerales bacterium]
MKTTYTHSTPARTTTRLLLTSAGLATAAVGFVGGCVHHHDDGVADTTVGHTKTTEKRVYDTPTDRTTVTETHERDTRIVR